ncbi:hypothetical protein [Rhizobium sp. ZW T2_16]|uniref:hypothetical protein n=1 Tax=Rhizobium sp. ZW T2_16 TaxID=3378083 RepID=UPI003854E925
MMLWDYDFRLKSGFQARPHGCSTQLDSIPKCSKHMRERENAQMIACDFDIAASCLPADQAGQRFFAFSKTMAKTTTKTV